MDEMEWWSKQSREKRGFFEKPLITESVSKGRRASLEMLAHLIIITKFPFVKYQVYSKLFSQVCSKYKTVSYT